MGNIVLMKLPKVKGASTNFKVQFCARDMTQQGVGSIIYKKKDILDLKLTFWT